MAAITIDSADLEQLVEAGITNRHEAFSLLNRLRVVNGKTKYASRSECQNFHPSSLNDAHLALTAALNAAKEAQA
jgi:hypothetical protein